MNPTHKRIAPLIARVATRFWEIYGGSQEDTFQAAWVIFLECEKTYDPSQGILDTRAEYLIFNRLLDRRRNEIGRRHKKAPVVSLDSSPAARREFNPQSFLSELSDDLAAIVEVFWEAPPRNVTETHFRHFCKKLGYGKTQIDSVVSELRSALTA